MPHGPSRADGGQTLKGVADPLSALRWLPLAIVLIGSLLRIVYTWGVDVRNVYDDHFQVARIMLEQHRWPHPDDGWQCYQPPLYHALSALTYRVFSGHAQGPPPPQPSYEERSSSAGIQCRHPWHLAGRKAIQFISTVCGIGTLWLVWQALRTVFPGRIFAQSLGVAFIAFLPRHIYMSGMATNDALTYLWASLCFWAILRAVAPPSDAAANDRAAARALARMPRNPAAPHRARYGWWLLAGLGAALAMWTKHYGLSCAVVLFAALAATVLVRRRATQWGGVRGPLLGAAVALALGIWPYVRNYELTGDPVVSPFKRLPNNMANQLPGELSKVSWASFRLGALLAHPWLHISTVDSFWTALYAELWFDYGTSTTAYQYRPWPEYVWPIWRDQSLSARERERRGLIWDLRVMPPAMVPQARALYLLGLLPAALAVLGCVGVFREAGGFVPSVVLLTALALGVATPLFQTIRQPFRSSMKAAFALHALVPLAVLLCAGCEFAARWRYGRWLRWALAADLTLLAIVAAWHFGYVSLVFPDTPEYFARRDLL